MSLLTRRVVVTAGIALAYAGSAALLGWATSGLLSAAAPGDDLDDLDLLLGLSACAAAWAVLTWLTAALALAVLTTASRHPTLRHPTLRHPTLRRAALRVAPPLVRRLAALLLGVGLMGTPVSTALAAHATGAVPAAGAAAGTEQSRATPPAPLLLDRPADGLAGWTPDRPAAPGRVRRTPPVGLVTSVPHAGTAVREDVVVRRGDTLWDLAARHLGREAAAAEIAREWPRWHAANRDLIGPDPHLIRPGQRLRPPAS